MFSFDPHENIRKPFAFWCFWGYPKGTLRRKGFIFYIQSQDRKKTFLIVCHLQLYYQPVRDLISASPNLEIDIGQKGTKNFTTSYAIPFVSVLHQNKTLHNFCKGGGAAFDYRTKKRSRLGPVQANFPFQTFENLWFSFIFRERTKRTLAWHGLNSASK